jgi:hypothetical protein
MTDHALPSYLQNRTISDFTDYASDGIGGMLPPHVSIQGNLFTLIDAAGQEYQPMQTMDCVIVDRSNVTCKMYFGKPWQPNQENRDPPKCWSTNGIGPSISAVEPQARTCTECKHNEKGSAVSAISGATIKACRDEYHFAILLPSMPNIMFRFVLTPGSFKHWQAYTGKFNNSNVRISMVVTRMSFVPKVNGEIQFESIAYIDEATNNLVQKALLEKATDVLCGRLDTPRVAAITVSESGHWSDKPVQQVQQPVPLSIPSVISPVASPTLTAGPVAATQPIVPEGAPVQRRRRRTAAEMAAANSGAATPAPTNGVGQPGQPIPTRSPAPQAPFPHPTSTPGTVPGTGPALGTQVQPSNFGIQQGQPAASNPELATMLDDFFKG